MGVQTVITLFDKLASQDLSSRYWVGKAVAGVAVADESIHPAEKPYLLETVGYFLEDATFLEQFFQIIHSKSFPSLIK